MAVLGLKLHSDEISLFRFRPPGIGYFLFPRGAIDSVEKILVTVPNSAKGEAIFGEGFEVFCIGRHGFLIGWVGVPARLLGRKQLAL